MCQHVSVFYEHLYERSASASGAAEALVALQSFIQYNTTLLIPSINGFSETNYNEIYKRNKIQYK